MNSFHHWSSRLCALIALLMTVLGAANAVLRYVSKYIGVNLSSNAALELQWYLFSALFLLGAAYTLEQNRHVRVDVLHRLMSPKLKCWVELLGTCLCCCHSVPLASGRAGTLCSTLGENGLLMLVACHDSL